MMLFKTMYVLIKTVFQDIFQMNPIKIAVHELSKTILKIILAFPEAEIYQFFMLHLA